MVRLPTVHSVVSSVSVMLTKRWGAVAYSGFPAMGGACAAFGGCHSSRARSKPIAYAPFLEIR